eukprot:CAMPEP_0197416922 /NCGR_PEP_ID=MMETSP1170-20131217/3109_1 /TAXON_ID=54406 /ORGANISM="Sarcinochrysis sp, Strain CCMP770" /LENGTH=246 /DNA_ID=CAMNT_0042943853 /DNA_START=104 /DNA_END=841 /DNA_ORIENTATION=-
MGNNKQQEGDGVVVWSAGRDTMVDMSDRGRGSAPEKKRAAEEEEGEKKEEEERTPSGEYSMREKRVEEWLEEDAEDLAGVERFVDGVGGDVEGGLDVGGAIVEDEDEGREDGVEEGVGLVGDDDDGRGGSLVDGGKPRDELGGGPLDLGEGAFGSEDELFASRGGGRAARIDSEGFVLEGGSLGEVGPLDGRRRRVVRRLVGTDLRGGGRGGIPSGFEGGVEEVGDVRRQGPGFVVEFELVVDVVP